MTKPASSLAAASLAKPIYTAQSRLLILLGDEYVFRRAVGDDQPVGFQRVDAVRRFDLQGGTIALRG